MAATSSQSLRGALIALALLAALFLPAPASAQAFDCSGNDWAVATATEFTAAISCWDAASIPGNYSITLTAAIASDSSILAKGSDYALRIDGNNHRLSETLALRGAEDVDPIDQSSFELVDLTAERVFVIQVRATITDTVIRSGLQVASGHLHGRSLWIDGHGDRGNGLEARESNVLLEDSVVEGHLDPALAVDSTVAVIRNSLIRNSAGLFAVFRDSEVLFDRTTIADNDLDGLSRFYCCPQQGSILSYVNSTVTGHDAQSPLNVAVGGFEGATVNIANSTIVGNGPHSALGPIDTRSSIVETCQLEPVSSDSVATEFSTVPVDLGGNVGGCFAPDLIEHYPLDDYGCAVPTPVGCVPTIATSATSPARGAGVCGSTLIADPSVDIFAIDVSTLAANPASVLTTIGTQTLDGRGLPRTSCDSGAYESDGFEPALPERLTIATLDLAHPVPDDNFMRDPESYGREIGGWIEEQGIDVLLVQRVIDGALVPDALDAIMRDLHARGYPMTYDYAPTSLVYPDTPYITFGQAVLTRFPIAERSSTVLPNPDPSGQPAVIQQVHLSVPLRIVNVRAFDGDPCGHIRAIDAALESSARTTILGGNLGADRTRGCVGEFTAGWADACALDAVNELCERTVTVGADDGEPTQDYLLHTSVTPPVARAWAETQPFFALDPFTPHWPVVAEYWIVGGPSDADGDGILDVVDRCPSVPGSGGDRDSDGIGDECDPVLGSDANCDGSRDIIDALTIAQFAAAVRTDAGDCPLTNPASELYAYGADANRDGSTDIIDALLIAQCDAGIDNVACPVPPAD